MYNRNNINHYADGSIMSNINNNNTFQSVNSGTTSSSSVSKDDIIRGLNEDLARVQSNYSICCI
jgi:hypothetical protein